MFNIISWILPDLRKVICYQFNEPLDEADLLSAQSIIYSFVEYLPYGQFSNYSGLESILHKFNVCCRILFDAERNALAFQQLLLRVSEMLTYILCTKIKCCSGLIFFLPIATRFSCILAPRSMSCICVNNNL